MKTYAPVPEGQGWTPLPHTTARNLQLSYKALGLLMELLSYPPGWETNIDKMNSINKSKGGHREGRDSMRQAMQELEREGYVTRQRVRQPDGSFETTVTVHNQAVTPDRRTGYQASVNQAPVRQSSANQPSENQASLGTLATDTETKTDSNTVDEDSAALAEARAAAAKNAAAREVIDKQLHDMYADVDAMKPPQRRNLLLKLERKRPKIYRDCRNDAIEQFNREAPEVFTEEWAAADVDRLSLLYALQHYTPKGEVRDWPAWIKPPRRPERGNWDA